ncbi:SpoIID/LytB domain-containing protein [Nocardioides korecus]
MLGASVVGTALLAPVAGADASVTVSQSYAVPADGVLKITGHGFGHGHGMSQYGAQGAAKQGLTAAQILKFYYPGTTLTSLGGTIRVLISADTDGDVRVAPAAGLRVRQVAGRASYALPTTAGITSWRLRTVAGATRLEYAKAGWHPYLPGGKALSGDAEFHRNGPVTLQVAGTTRVYRGALRLSAGRTVDVVGIDNYVRGVVPREMPPSWMPAALQAQAVAARTYAAFDRAAHPNRSWQTCDTTSCQVYGGVAAEDSRSDAAVSATAAQVVTYAGGPAFTQFGSSSGGWLTDGGQPYLVAKADPYDDYAGNPVHTWTTTVSRATLQRRWPAVGTLQRVVVTQRDGHGQWSGRVEQLVLKGTAGSVTVGGPTFRSTLGLRTSWFAFG